MGPIWHDGEASMKIDAYIAQHLPGWTWGGEWWSKEGTSFAKLYPPEAAQQELMRNPTAFVDELFASGEAKRYHQDVWGGNA